MIVGCVAIYNLQVVPLSLTATHPTDYRLASLPDNAQLNTKQDEIKNPATA